MKPYVHIIALFILGNVLAAPVALAASCSMQPATITGYFTPIDTDYYHKPGDLLSLDFLKLFIIQWMGITERWGVIGLWDSDGDGQVNVHINLPCPLDAQGNCLVAYDDTQPDKPGTAASNYLEPGTQLRVGGPTGNLYTITDTIGITNGHDETLLIDLYMGEGEAALQKARDVNQINGTGRVCVY